MRVTIKLMKKGNIIMKKYNKIIKHNNKLKKYGLDPFLLNHLGIEYKLYNPNPKQEKKDGVSMDDCYIRALCKFFNRDWSDISIDLAKKAIKIGATPCHVASNIDLIRDMDLEVYEIKYDESIAQFMYEHKKGKYIIFGSYHTVCYIDGVLYDSAAMCASTNKFLTDDIRAFCKYKKK